MRRVLIIPGNGCSQTESANWYGWARRALSEYYGDAVIVMAPNMPDPMAAHEKIWIPFLLNLVDKDTVVVGHSSGAQAVLRLAEKIELHALIIVSACVTDGGDAGERESGWYDRPFQWDLMKQNVTKRFQFASRDDPLIPFEAEQMEVARQLDPELTVFDDRKHIWQQTFPELIDLMQREFPKE